MQTMNEKLTKFVENYGNAFIVGDYLNSNIIYANKTACILYDIELNSTSIDNIFKHTNKTFNELLTDELQENNIAIYNNVAIQNKYGIIQTCDVDLGFFNNGKTEVYVEITPKEDKRMEMAYNQVDSSSRAEAILNFDEKLSVLHCNELFHRVFESDKHVQHTHYGNNFSNGFQPDIREQLLADIHENLKKSNTYFTKMKIITTKGLELWYSLELQRRTLDNSGVDKIMAYMVNIETQVELENISQYFGILQSITKGYIYRFDIKNKVLYRDKDTAIAYGVAVKEENYPNREKLEKILHKDDIDEYLNFIENVIKGEEGSHESRLKLLTGAYEYYKITFKAVRNHDGSIKEMIGNAVSVQELKETEAQLNTINQYFDILQSFSKDLLYRLDIKTKTLYRNENCSLYYGIPPVVENYPTYEQLQGVFHPDDIENYAKFIETVLQGNEATHTARMMSITGNFEYHKITFKKLLNPDGTVNEMVGHASNIHSLMALETRATYDMLTNCLNKISFQEQVSKKLEHSNLNIRHALIFVDLDDFKGINDNLGHTFGDFLLETVGSRLKKLVRENDLVGRVGGDEFVIFLDNCGDDVHLQRRGTQILKTLREEYSQNTTSATIKGSVGVAIYPSHGTTYDELYENADKALYRSKNLGKDVVTIYYKGIV